MSSKPRNCDSTLSLHFSGLVAIVDMVGGRRQMPDCCFETFSWAENWAVDVILQGFLRQSIPINELGVKTTDTEVCSDNREADAR